ncbi:EAL domain-containing protein [Leptospira noguchii]|uniref:Cyclic diguanylate phosphodiesterase (EAL) domain protein n=2 Tax=Leptospira noguchii TaxID=28182 RepID=M6YHL2_9LEPT|nr:EAL domain-containing protein [Leptospira noguchii]EMI64239.1 cyclic diguanylate phosphodiesterase (EAL) domain protein [Leptospira noguchii str. Bonito]EMM99077.1 cyclic diguanylate phosphodiesterase (EAL) domain protein [Leptospira noguchii str. 2007001578]EMO89089.1 cyclic diguanylate phosphodiesterase (EAL) domain protein [Leptospira noguchii str. 2001034031]EMS89580.1 cyclic diguanylate phosphodiesterase (EAL) domain protein [Leptospira noguchii str. Cascata]EPE86475.1 cyclic diguanyla
MLYSQDTSNLLSYGENNYQPHYQPILEVTNCNIIGYEVLGRFYFPEKNEYRSLGYQFHNPELDAIRLIQIDRLIREKAIRHLKDSGLRTKLFLNMMPNFLSMIHTGDVLDLKRIHVLNLIEKYDIPPSEVVLEITEDKFDGNIEKLLSIVNVFKDYGFKIAVDDLGVGFSNLERIGYIHPDIMKVDIKIMRESLNRRSFKNVLSAIADMSQKLGSDLLFEGIETEEELHLALSMGANLLQGFYFSRPQVEFQDKKQFTRTLRDTLEKFSGLRFMELLEEFQKGQSVIDSLGEKLEALRHNGKEDLPLVLHLMLSELPTEILSVFACDIFGYQITPTYFRVHPGEEWDSDLTEIGNNYAWRPFFIRHKAKVVQNSAKWTVTEPMYDMDLHKQVVIFTYTLRDNYILVIKMDWETEGLGQKIEDRRQ